MTEPQIFEQGTRPAEAPVAPPAPAPPIQETPEAHGAGPRARIIRIGVVLAVIIAAIVIWRIVRTPDIPESVVALSGRIEGDDSAIASKTSGRILEVRVREGDHVRQGDVLATLDDEQVRARENQARSAVEQAQARLVAAQEQIAVLQQQLIQNKLQAAQSGDDAAGRVSQA
jgi:HlyD family secretion protein